MHHSESFCPQVVMQIACGAVTFSFLGRDEAVSRASTSSCTGGLAAQHRYIPRAQARWATPRIRIRRSEF